MFQFNQSKLTIIVGIVMVASWMLSACLGPVIDEPVESKSRVVVDVRTFSLGFEEFEAKTGNTPATRLSFAVFDTKGTLVGTAIHQESSDESFGTFELELYPGNYTLVAVAHNGDADAVITSPTSVSLPGTTFTDTFTKVQNLTVESGKDCNLSMTLPRVTSAFVLRLAATPPANVKEIKVIVNTGGFLLSQVNPSTLGINPETGLASNNWKFTHTIPIADISKDLLLYFIGQNNPTAVNIKATAYATDGTEIISHTLNNVSLVPNRKTIATGNFFKSQGSGSFTFGSTWNPDNEMNY